MRIGSGRVAHDLRVWSGSPLLGDVGRLQDEEGGALAHHESVSTAVEGSGGLSRIAVVAVPERPNDVERPERQRAQRHLNAPGDRRIDLARPDRAERLPDGYRPRRTRVGGRQDGATDIQGDAQVRRRGAAEYSERERR